MSIKTLDAKLDLSKGISLFKILWEFYIILIIVYVVYIIKSFDVINCYYVFNLTLSVLSIFISIFVIKRYYKSGRDIILFVPVVICILLQGWHYIYYQSRHDINYKANQLYINAIGNDLINDDEFYRVKYMDCMYNMNLYFNESSIDSFTSTVSPSIFKIYNSLDMYRKQNTSINLRYRNLINFYSTKYIVSCSNIDYSKWDYKYLYKKGKYTVYLNEDYQKMGIILNDRLNKDELDKLPNKMKLYTENYIDNGDNIVINNAKILSLYSKKITNGIYSKVNLTKSATIIYTIPYDKNFEVRINGKISQYFEINNGLIGVNLNEGASNIKIIYKATTFKYGVYICTASILLLVLYRKLSKKMI
jgi:hypothetical protein